MIAVAPTLLIKRYPAAARQGETMTSQKIAGFLGTIVALIVLAAAFYYVPPGAKNAPPPQAAPTEQPAAVPAPAPPPGPVVKDIPQQ
jgi:hypothetical protein